MALFDSNKDVIGLLRPVVLLNGRRFDVLKCNGVSSDPGCGGYKADFTVPQYLFDTSRRELTDGFVSVTMNGAYDESDTGNPDFLGYVDVDNASVGGGANGVSLSALSITGMFNKVGTGDWDDQPVLKYSLVNEYDGSPTEWSPRRVLADLIARLPPKYRDRVRLGNTAVLEKPLADTPDLEFRFQTYANMIDTILALYGDVTFTERYVGSICYLDFYRIQSAGAPTVRVKLANKKDPLDSGATVEELGHSQTTNDAITRVKAYGTKKRYIITVLSDGENPEANLVKGWDLTLEEAVLKNPRRAKPGAPGYVPGMELVRRRFYLPAALRPYLKLKNLGLKRLPVGDQEGPKYKAQVWKLATTLALDEDGKSVGTENTEGSLISQVSPELDNGYFELTNVEDGLNITGIESGEEGKIAKTTWVPAKIGITLCVEGNKFLVVDTGPGGGNGIGYDIAQDGLYDRITRDDLTYLQFSNVGLPVLSPAGVPCEWTAYIYNEDSKAWEFYAEPAVVTDDSKTLMSVAREHLRARNKRHHAYEVTVPYFSRAFKPGYRLIVDGQENWAGEIMTITGVNWDLAGNSTSMTVDNVKPPSRRKAKV